MAGIIAKQFDSLGIRLESRAWRYTVYKDKVDNRECQFTLNGWYADYPDPENFALLLYGPNERNKGPNESCYDSPEFNRLFEKMRAMEDGPERAAIVHRMRDVAEEDCPWIYLWHEDNLMLYNDWLSNIKPNPVANDFAKYIRVDGPRRARMQAEWNKPNYWPVIAGAALFIAGTLPAAAVVRKRRNRRVRVRHGGTN
jgi:ABC-type transport system substrate-binding protein